jgi:cell division protein FtsI (penicillin-binding protein 3)
MTSSSHSYRGKRVAPGLLHTRFQCALLLCLMWTGAIFLRLIYLQVIEHNYYVARANRQRQSIVMLDPERGPILDRKGRQLAISIAVQSIYGIPEEMKDPAKELRVISELLPIDVKDLTAHLKNNKSFLWIARKITPETADKIRSLELPGIFFTQESRRFYPNKELAAHVLGFVGIDNKGLSGVEYQYDNVVCGVPGRLNALRDAKKRILLSEKSSLPTVGRTLQLTIDSGIQHIAEEELKAAVEEQNANGGAVIIMNPYNGEILALANEPSFNPNAYLQYHSMRWKNKAIQDYYEPGSTFKPVILTAALDQGLVTPDDLFDCQHGSITVAGHVIKDHKPFGTLTLREVIAKSSNVGMIKVGLKVGPRSLFEYATSFGFGKRTGIDLPGEAPGLVRPPEKWSAISIGAFSIGQELGVTPVQVLRMMSAISNGGYLPAPHCVAKISDSNGNLKPTVFAEPQALPVQHDTITTLQDLVEGVVKPGGSGTLAEIPGYRVAGKTGTAQRIGPSGTYVDGGYFASFVGYAPASHPAFTMIVLLDGPKKEHYGGRVAAPLFRKIGQQVLKYLDIPPDQITENPVLQAESAFPRETEANLFPEGIEPVAYTPPEQHHKLAIAGDDGKASGLVMPYLYGKTMGESVELLSKTKAQFRLLGTGTVVKQWPLPGTLLNEEDVCIITLESTSPNSSVVDLNALRK